MSGSGDWREGTRASIKEMLRDPILSSLLARSNLTKAQFETLLIDQLGHDMANKRLTRNEMAALLRSRQGISRGALNRTLRQARENISEAIHTVLLLGYGGLIESPSLAPFLEASEMLEGKMRQLGDLAESDPRLYSNALEAIMRDLEEAFKALYGKARDM
jgi:hypothetical protein